MTSDVHHLPSLVRARVVPAGERGRVMEHVTWLTPYMAETIAHDARRAGPGARLEIIVPEKTAAAGLAAVEALFAWLSAKGIAVTVRRDGQDG